MSPQVTELAPFGWRCVTPIIAVSRRAEFTWGQSGGGTRPPKIRAEDAPALVDKAIKLSPLDPDLGRFYWIMGRAYFTQGKYDKAIENLQPSIQLRPPTWFIRAQLISA